MALLPALLPVPSSWASDADPLTSPACLQSLHELDRLRQQAAATRAIEAARQQATQACLQGPAPERPVPRSPQPPVRVAPVTPAPAPPVALPPPTRPVQVERPSVVTTCDATGCWDGEGRRLNRMGAELVGPRGFCTPVGSHFVCP